MTLNRNQILAIAGVICSVLMVSSSQLTDLFGPGVAKSIIAGAGLLNGIMSGALAIITGQSGMVKDVAAMQGVEPIKINAQANATLAAIAVDPDQPKVGGTTEQVQSQLKEIAKG